MTESEKLTSENVESIFHKLFYDKDVFSEDLESNKEKILNNPNTVIVEGITLKNVVFDKTKVEEHKETIRKFLEQIPHQFHQNSGGGWSFLNLCINKDDEQWTGFHSTMEMLTIIGIAAGFVSYTLPRDLWDALPGGMPYITINTSQLN